jgi:hypothetical protein
VNRLLTNGLRYLFGGARRGQSSLAGLGAAMTIAGWLRRRRGPERELLWARNLKDGESVTIKMVRGEVVDVEVGE